MRKSAKCQVRNLLFGLFTLLLASTALAGATDPPPANYRALSDTLVERARLEVERIKALVEDGTLPKIRLEQAETALADAQDEAILVGTLYGQPRIQDMTSDQAQAMLGAAQRRVDRQSKIVEDRRKLLETGILARSEFATFQDELDSRSRVLQLAQNRAQLLEDLHQMAETERRFEHAAQGEGLAPKDAMTRYDGNGLFNLGDLPTISSEFQKRFHHPLPISALGQTLVHQSMGLDHRNRVDVALNPDQPEGIWLRQLLERLHVPYLAFRSAMTGAATAPHIHIGVGSTRLKLAMR